MHPLRAFFWIPVAAVALFAVTHARGRNVSSGELNDWAVLGGVERRIDSPKFEGGAVTALLGGVKLDLRNAGAGSREMELDVTAVMGGVQVTVPRDWEVVVRGTSVLGGFKEHGISRRDAEQEAPRLVITGLAFMGGVEVQH
jgi:predicted membrane protein